MFAADALISVNVGELNITIGQLTAIGTTIGAAITAIWNKTVNYLRDRDAREAALRQQIFDLAIAFSRSGEKQAASVQSLADKVKA